jgi:predicted amidohydrolase
MIKIAICQLLIEGGEPIRNFNRAKEFIIEASKKKANLIIFPECSDFGWTHPSYKKAKTIPGKYSFYFQELAKKNKIDICIGLTEKLNNNFFNSAIYINKKGLILSHYRKINLLNEEANAYYEPGSKLEVFDSEFAKIGISICADNYSKSSIISHLLSRMGADIIISPSSWTVNADNNDQNPYNQKWSSTMKEVTAIYNNTFIAVTSIGYIVGGPVEGRKMIGCSLAYKNGKQLIELNNNEVSSELKIINITVNKNKIKKCGTELSNNISINI